MDIIQLTEKTRQRQEQWYACFRWIGILKLMSYQRIAGTTFADSNSFIKILKDIINLECLQASLEWLYGDVVSLIETRNFVIFSDIRVMTSRTIYIQSWGVMIITYLSLDSCGAPPKYNSSSCLLNSFGIEIGNRTDDLSLIKLTYTPSAWTLKMRANQPDVWKKSQEQQDAGKWIVLYQQRYNVTKMGNRVSRNGPWQRKT